MVAALLVFSLVVDGGGLNGRAVEHGLLYLHLAGRPVTLEVLHIGSGIPQTPLREGEELQCLDAVGGVLQGQLLHFCPSL